MKISKLQLDGFGKFNNREITFREGLNIVYGLNESGKSTVQMFILSMLFGAKKDFYSKYKPWHIDNCNFGGELEYKLGKEEYKIIREFNEKSKTIVKDKISDEDITEKFKSSKFSEPRIMEKQVGINRQCFLKTIFCKQSEMADVKSAKDFVAQKLMNVSESGDEDLSISDSIAKLEKLKENMTTNDKNSKGKKKNVLKMEENKKILVEINKIEKEILKLQKAYAAKKEERDALEEKLRNYRERLNSIEESSRMLMNEQAAAVSNIYRGLKKEDFKELQSEYLKYTNNMSKIEKIKEDINDTFIEINNNKNILNGINNDRINEMEVEYINLCNEIATCRQQIQTSEVLIRDKKNSYNDFLKSERVKSIIKISSISVSSILCFILSIYTLWGLAAFLVPIAVFTYTVCAKKEILNEEAKVNIEIEKIEEKKRHVSGELEQKEQKYNNILKEISMEPGDILDKLKELRKTYNRQMELDLKLKTSTINLQSTQSELEYQSKEISKIIKRTGAEDIDLKNLDNLVTDIIEEYKAISNGLKNISDEELNIHELNKNIAELNVKIKELNLELSDMQKKIDIKFESLSNYPMKDEITYNISKYQKEYEKEQKELEAIDKAIATLKESREKVRSQYGELLVDGIVKKISKITRNKYKIVNIDDIVQMNTVNEENKEISIEGLSGGTIDQFYFSWRTALAEVMSDSHYKLPIIIDEPFAQYDDKRLEEAVEVLNDIAKDRQVILFTCQKRDIEVTKSICAQKFNLIYL